jgi:hypothetical protein
MELIQKMVSATTQANTSLKFSTTATTDSPRLQDAMCAGASAGIQPIQWQFPWLKVPATASCAREQRREVVGKKSWTAALQYIHVHRSGLLNIVTSR